MINCVLESMKTLFKTGIRYPVIKDLNYVAWELRIEIEFKTQKTWRCFKSS